MAESKAAREAYNRELDRSRDNRKAEAAAKAAGR